MSKLLLILDSEELNDDCLNCPCRYEYVGGVGCRAAYEDVECEYIPEWCPLHLLPERKWEPDETDTYEGGYADGWNDCLDEIGG